MIQTSRQKDWVYTPPPTRTHRDPEGSKRAWDETNLQFACSHDEKALRVGVSSNGVRQYRTQCLHCGEKGEAIAHAKLTEGEKDSASQEDRGIRDKHIEQWREAYHRRKEELDGAYRLQHRETWNEWYERYLASDQWREKRRQVLSRDRGLCQFCSNARATEVHHKTYANVGKEPLDDLTSVCRECHERYHFPDDN
jgi:5-methylcytosine-specific restriction endonuclease McrA